MTKISLSCQNCSKSRIISYEKNVENHAFFVDGFWSEFYARGRFMKYSMSALKPLDFYTIVHLGKCVNYNQFNDTKTFYAMVLQQ